MSSQTIVFLFAAGFAFWYILAYHSRRKENYLGIYSLNSTYVSPNCEQDCIMQGDPEIARYRGRDYFFPKEERECLHLCGNIYESW